jgi:hypothetical protein
MNAWTMSNPAVEIAAAAAVLPGRAEGSCHENGPTRNPIVPDRAAAAAVPLRPSANRITIPERLEVMRTMGLKVGSSRRRDGHYAAYLGRVGRSWNVRNLEAATAWCVTCKLDKAAN